MFRQGSIAAVLVGLAAGIAAEAPGERKLTVYMLDGPIPCTVSFRGRAVTQKIFDRIGVKIEWRSGAPRREAAVEGRRIIVDFSTETPDKLRPGALGYAEVYEGVKITVFYDRVRTLTPQTAGVTLGHVLAHEITHLLEGVNRHSETGLMKAHWSVGDFARMAWKPLEFTPLDVQLIEDAFASRAAAAN